MKLPENCSMEIASDVSGGRDGIGIQVFRGEKMLIEIFRDDSKKTRELNTFGNDLGLELVESAIALFRAEIPHDFIEYDG